MGGGRTEILLRTRLPSSALAIRRNDRSRNERLRRCGWPGNFRLIVVGRGMYGLGKQSMRILEKDMQLNKALDARSQSSHAEQWRRRKVSEFGIVDFRRCLLRKPLASESLSSPVPYRRAPTFESASLCILILSPFIPLNYL
jgi:hypothetical protein